MSRKKAFAPFVLLSGFTPPTPGDDGGYGSDQHGNDPYNNNALGPVTFADWVTMYGTEENGGSFEAYGQWWVDNGFSMDAWNEFNPNSPLSWEPESDE